MDIQLLAEQFSQALIEIDGEVKDNGKYGPGIGPHNETTVTSLLAQKLIGQGYEVRTEEHYENEGRLDMLVVANESAAIEFKVIRIRATGNPEPHLIKQILSPYPEDRSALTDIEKVSTFDATHKIFALIVYQYEVWNSDLLVDLFQMIARTRKDFEIFEHPFEGLRHQFHKKGKFILHVLED